MSKFAKFTEMVNGTAEDYVPIVEASMEHNTDLPKRILEHLEMLKGDHGGFAVDRYTHCLLTATRAYRDGRDDEYVFQGYYFFHFLGLDRNMRDNFKDNEHWRDCAEFCAKYDQNSFDPDYDTLPIETFVPMLEKVLSKTKKSIYKAD